MYTPIEPIDHPKLLDVPISFEKEMFTQVPQLGFLMSRFESVRASSLYYDPLDEEISRQAGVSYLRTRMFNTLSDVPLKLRHLGSAADMEITIDMYAYIPKGADLGDFSVSPRAFSMREGDRYERTSSVYVYHNIPVPARSNVVWDGRHSLCIEGDETVDASSRLGKVRGEARAALEDPELIPYTVMSLGGFAHTVNEPDLSRNKSKYDSIFDGWLIENYNAEGIPPKPLSNAGLSKVAKYASSNGRYGYHSLASSRVAALLSGDYFTQWISFDVYNFVEVTIADD